MQISLRSQMIAGTAAFVGASAIALTPVAPAMNLPALSTSNAAVALSAFANPISALLDTAFLVGNYTLNGVNTTPSENWPNSGTGSYPSGIGNLVNAALPGYGVTRPGLVQNILTNPLPVLTALAANWSGYGWIGLQSAAASIDAVGNILWTIPTTAIDVVLEVITLQFDAIIPTVTAAVQSIISDAQVAVGSIIAGVQTIATSIISKGAGVAQYLVDTITKLPAIVVGQLTLIGNSLGGVVQNVIAAVSAPNPVQGVWNALVGGLLDGLTPGSLPATVINLTQGAGVQAAGGLPPTFVPSLRTAVTATLSGVADVLNGQTPPPLPGAAEAPDSVSPAAARAAVAAPAAAVEAAPAAEVAAGESDAAPSAATARGAAAEDAAAPAVTAASEAGGAGDNDAAAAKADEPAPAKGRAAAHRGGRS